MDNAEKTRDAQSTKIQILLALHWSYQSQCVSVCVCVCVCVCARARARSRVCAHVRACMCMCNMGVYGGRGARGFVSERIWNWKEDCCFALQFWIFSWSSVQPCICKHGVTCMYHDIGLANDDVTKLSDAENWFKTKVPSHTKACREKSLSLDGALYSFVERFERFWQLLHCLVRHISKDSGDRTSAGPLFGRSTIDLPACFCMGRYLCLEPILPVATAVAGLWRSTCNPDLVEANPRRRRGSREHHATALPLTSRSRRLSGRQICRQKKELHLCRLLLIIEKKAGRRNVFIYRTVDSSCCLVLLRRPSGGRQPT